MAAASAAAASTGKPVEILADRTDSTQTFAEPGGGYSTHESLVPRRVQRPDGLWARIDTSLVRQADGSIAPVAITTGLSISGGGNGPLYSLFQDGMSMSMYWPGGPLPAPSLSGPTAAYTGVLPGVNLLVTATADGVSELLEVTNARAAANPALFRLEFPTRLHGLTVSRDAAGNLRADRGDGRAVFSAPPAEMWDSSGVRAAATALVGASAVSSAAGFATQASAAAIQAGGPLPGDHVALMKTTPQPGSLTLVPDRGVLSGAGATYPVFIDPRWNGQESTGATWLDVWKDGAGHVGGDWQPQDQTYGGIRSGVACNNSTNGVCSPSSPDGSWLIYRAYLNFPISKATNLGSADFVDAQLSINEMWSWTCSVKTTIDLYQTDRAYQGSTWSTQPTQRGLSDSQNIAYGDTCPAHGVTFDAKPALSAVQGGPNLTLELRATSTDESNWNVNSWKRWSAASADLIVYWRHAPDKPTGVAVQGVLNPATGKTTAGCSASATSPDFVNVVNPVWQATIDDIDAHNGDDSPIDGEFAWTNLTNPNTGTAGASQNPASPGGQFTGSRSGGSGDEYKWSAYGLTPALSQDADGNPVPALQGPSSAACYFQIDTNAPSIAPAITNEPNAAGKTFTSGEATNPVGTPAVFQFSDRFNIDPSDGTNDIVGYRYGLNSSPDIYVPAATKGGDVSVTITPSTNAALDVYVQAIDRAGNPSPTAGPFELLTNLPPGNIATLARWKLNDGSGTVAADATGNGADATLATGATLGCTGAAGPSGYPCTLDLDGGGGRAFTANPVTGNDASFSVSAWVDPTSCSSTCIAISQGDTHTSGFALGYQKSCTQGSTTGACWVFSMPASDSTTAVVTAVRTAPGTAVTGAWTQLTGVFDATHGQLLLYVNGGDGTPGDGNPAASTAPLTVQPWNAAASGVLRLGATWTSTSGPENFWGGSLSAACAFYGALSSTDVRSLYDNGAGDGCGALFTQYP